MKKIYFNTKLILLAILINLTGVVCAQINITLGTGTAAHSNTDAGPINQFYRSLHAQTVYTAAELNTAGVNGGTITKLGFYIVSGVTNPLPNYTIKLKHTSAGDAATYDGTGLTTVYNNASYNPTAGGFDMLTFTTPFNWNGVDNILVDICFDQVSAYTSTGVVRVYNTAVTNGYIFIRDDSAPQCGLACNSILNSKPQVQLEFLPPAPLDLGVSAFVRPLGSKICFGTDTVIATLKNYGSAIADFSVNQTTLTVNTTGPNASTFTVAITSGTLATNATQDFTLSTNFNLGTVGTYKFKGYTTVIGDGTAVNDTARLTITRAPVFATSVLPNDSVCLGVPVQINTSFSSTKQVGTGTLQNTSTSYPAPYGNWYEGAKHQFLFLASELTSAGLTAGNINSLAFNATNLNASDPYTNFNIAIATTTITNITAFQTTGFTTYYSAASYIPVLGTNTHTFTTPFVWDGVSNIIVETCFDNTSSGFSNNVSVSQSTTPFTSSVWRNEDGNTAICSAAMFSSLSQRPNISFEQPATISYSWSPAIELSASNIPNPIANVTSSRTYTVEGTIGTCMTQDTIRIHIKPTPTPNLGNDSLFCSLPVIINANTTANSYLWNNSSVNSSLNVTTPGKYWVRATNSNGCSNSDTILVTLGQSPIVTLGPDTVFCQGKTINLYAGAGAGNSYLWNTGSTASSISVGTAGTYSVVVTNSIGCVKSDVINIGSKPLPAVSLVFAGTHTYCVTENINRSLVEGVPANGTYIGAGVTNTSFNPSQAGQGNHIILYNIVGANGCLNTAKDTLVVSACVNIDELSSEDLGINVYPNPSSGVFTVELNTNSDVDGILTITSIDGKLVFNDTISGNGIISKSINIGNLAEGIYYLKVETKNAVRTYKVLKQ
jgi:hypothetical protein